MNITYLVLTVIWGQYEISSPPHPRNNIHTNSIPLTLPCDIAPTTKTIGADVGTNSLTSTRSAWNDVAIFTQPVGRWLSTGFFITYKPTTTTTEVFSDFLNTNTCKEITSLVSTRSSVCAVNNIRGVDVVEGERVSRFLMAHQRN